MINVARSVNRGTRRSQTMKADIVYRAGVYVEEVIDYLQLSTRPATDAILGGVEIGKRFTHLRSRPGTVDDCSMCFAMISFCSFIRR